MLSKKDLYDLIREESDVKVFFWFTLIVLQYIRIAPEGDLYDFQMQLKL